MSSEGKLVQFGAECAAQIADLERRLAEAEQYKALADRAIALVKTATPRSLERGTRWMADAYVVLDEYDALREGSRLMGFVMDGSHLTGTGGECKGVCVDCYQRGYEDADHEAARKAARYERALRQLAQSYHLVAQQLSEYDAHSEPTFETCGYGRCIEAAAALAAEEGE